MSAAKKTRSSKKPSSTRPADTASPPAEGGPIRPQHDRTAALADGLRETFRDGDISHREYARQMQEITREAAPEADGKTKKP